jgi:hypothetical protein
MSLPFLPLLCMKKPSPDQGEGSTVKNDNPPIFQKRILLELAPYENTGCCGFTGPVPSTTLDRSVLLFISLYSSLTSSANLVKIKR